MNSFLRQSGIPENLILFANTTAEHGRNAYFVFIDSKMSCVVIAIRGTLSLSDCFTDVDADPASLRDLGLDGHWGHSGAKLAALRIKDEVFSQPGVTNALQHFRKLRIVGHSLGAASSVMLTLALSNELHDIDLHCFAFGPPLLLDEQLAKSEKARTLITSFVYRDDVAPRLSLHTVRKLKAQVLRCFELANKSRWEILSARISGSVDQLFDAEFVEDPDFLNLDRDVLARMEVEVKLVNQYFHEQRT
jgi:sn1-specific diacylglycerol lipase